MVFSKLLEIFGPYCIDALQMFSPCKCFPGENVRLSKRVKGSEKQMIFFFSLRVQNYLCQVFYFYIVLVELSEPTRYSDLFKYTVNEFCQENPVGTAKSSTTLYRSSVKRTKQVKRSFQVNYKGVLENQVQ